MHNAVLWRILASKRVGVGEREGRGQNALPASPACRAQSRSSCVVAFRIRLTGSCLGIFLVLFKGLLPFLLVFVMVRVAHGRKRRDDRNNALLQVSDSARLVVINLATMLACKIDRKQTTFHFMTPSPSAHAPGILFAPFTLLV